MGDPGSSLVDLVRHSDVVDVIASTVDSAGGLIFESRILEAFPIAGTALGVIRAGRSARDYLFTKKVLKFVGATSAVTQLERDKFYEWLLMNGKMQEFGETILLILEKSDHMEKAAIAGRMMAARMCGHVEYEAAMRICNMVDRCYISDLRTLKTLSNPLPDNIQYRAGSILFSGLATPEKMDGEDYNKADASFIGEKYVLNKYALILKKYGL